MDKIIIKLLVIILILVWWAILFVVWLITGVNLNKWDILAVDNLNNNLAAKDIE